jgi:hypothetical protein
MSANTSAEFRRRMVKRLPDYGCLKVLNHQLRFLFAERAHA